MYQEYGEQLRRMLWGVVGDANLVQDIIQTTFRKLVEMGHETEAETRKAWLFQVAYREGLSHRRRQTAHKKLIDRLQEAQSTEAVSAEDPLVRQEVADTVREAIEELSPDLQQVLRMRIYEDKTFAQIAEQLDIPIGTALGRMRNATIKLRAKLAWTQRDA
ncbi:sigma-70 family RNA polymerase sigma factor [Blastopirellula marina]|uniref:Sigma-70 family RNA polymerase sigma factor n=2 Tax=Blastopirellula marina TaxID=124 RepID=A0A2S8GTN1_9BACT|nr:sigma-70 family RNA polymerase sigma factor [Blastopirellula marina]